MGGQQEGGYGGGRWQGVSRAWEPAGLTSLVTSRLRGNLILNLGFPRYKIQFAKCMKLKKNKDQSVDTLPLPRNGNKTYYYLLYWSHRDLCGVPRHPTQELLLQFGFSRRAFSNLRAKVKLIESEFSIVFGESASPEITTGWPHGEGGVAW